MWFLHPPMSMGAWLAFDWSRLAAPVLILVVSVLEVDGRRDGRGFNGVFFFKVSRDVLPL